MLSISEKERPRGFKESFTKVWLRRMFGVEINIRQEQKRRLTDVNERSIEADAEIKRICEDMASQARYTISRVDSIDSKVAALRSDMSLYGKNSVKYRKLTFAIYKLNKFKYRLLEDWINNFNRLQDKLRAKLYDLLGAESLKHQFTKQLTGVDLYKSSLSIFRVDIFTLMDDKLGMYPEIKRANQLARESRSVTPGGRILPIYGLTSR